MVCGAGVSAPDVPLAEPHHSAQAPHPPLARARSAGRQAAQVCVLSVQPKN